MASRIKGITVEIGGDVTKLDKALRDVNGSIKNTQDQLKDVERLLKLDPGNTELLAQKQQLLAKAIEDTRKKLETLKEAERQAQEQFQRGEISQEQYMGLQREIAATEIKLNDLEGQAKNTGISLENVGSKALDLADKLKNGLATAAEAAAKGFEAVESVGKKAGDAVSAALKGFAAASTAVARFGAAATKTGMEFDATMSQVSAISGAAGKDFQDLRDKALEMGAKTKFSASEAAEAMTYMGMAGWKAGDMISGIEGIMNLAAASGEDLATTSDIVTDALTAFGKSAGDAGRLADIMAATATSANTDVGMMGDTFRYVAPVAGALGFEMEDTALAIGLMANSGIKATQAGTSLRSIFTRLSTNAGATKTQLGALDIMTQQLGVSFYRADGSVRSLYDILVESQVAWEGLSEAEQINYAKTIAGQEAMSGWLALMNAAPEDVAKLSDAIYDCNGAAEEMSAIMVDNLKGDLTLLGSAFESLQIAISDSLTPTLREFAKFGKKAMANLLEGFQGNGVIGFMSALSSIVTDGVTMLAQKAPEFVNVTLQFVESMATGLLNAGPQVVEAAGEIIFMLVNTVPTFLADHAQQIAQIGTDLIREISVGFTEGIYHLRGAIGELIPMIVDGFLSYHEALFAAGLAILSEVGQGIVENKDEIQKIASGAIERMVEALAFNAPMIIDGAIALLEALVGAILDNASRIGETAVDIVSHLATSIGEAAPDLIPAAVGAVLKFLEGLTNPESLNNLIGGALAMIGGLVDGLVKAVPLLIAYAPEIVVNLVSGIISALPQLVEVGGQLIMGLIDGLIQGIVAIPEAIARVAGAVIDGFKALFGIHSPSTVFADIGGLLIQGLINGISNAWNSLKNFVNGLFDGLIGGVKSLLGIHSPSTVFANIGSNMALGLGEGWDDEYNAIKDKIKDGLNFGTASVGLTASASYSTAGTAQNGPQGVSGGSGNTYVTINSPVAVDAVQAAREWKKTTQRMAMGYV